MSCIKLNNIYLENNRLSYKYDVSDDLKIYFNDKPLTIEYETHNFSNELVLKNVPNSILVLPFVGNVLPIIWLFDAELIIPEIDETFYHKVNDIKNGYQQMYPALSFKGSILAEKIVKTTTDKNSSKYSSS